MIKILVIEDQQSLREDIVQIVECLDYVCLSAENGKVGVELAQIHLPDLIICDIMMPELNGYEVFEKLHENTATATIPFIFLSAKADRLDIRQGMNLGADDYLTKPFSIPDLQAAIAARLKQQVVRKQSEEKLKESEEQFRQLAQREELLNSLTKQIRKSLELKNILHTTLKAIHRLLQIHRCQFFWYRIDVNPAYFELIDEFSEPEIESIPNYNPMQEVPLLGEKLLDLHLFQINDIYTDNQLDQISREHLKSLGFSSLLAICIQTHSRKVGVILCQQFNQPRHWLDKEVSLLQAVADQLAIAIDQAELYAKSGFTAAAAQIQAQQLEKALSELKQTQSQLIQTEKMSSLGQLVAGVAHEINNPVNFISGNIAHVRNYVQDLLELLNLYVQSYPHPTAKIQEQSENMDLEFMLEDLPKVLSSMEMGAERIRQIVLSLRNFSRLEEAEMKPVNIHDGIDSTLLILQSRLKAQGTKPAIEIIKEYGDLPLVECYAGQLNQVFMNILVNAIDAIDEDNIQQQQEKNIIQPSQIIIRTEVLEGERITVGIIDNGSGIPENIKEHIFDPFFTTKAVGKGTGLGLSISYQIITDKHKGKIQCISAPQEGTAFWITIPIVQK